MTDLSNLRALSVRQPWSHAIIHLGKDIENRSRMLGHRGLTLIHASAGLTPDEYSDAFQFMAAVGAGPIQNLPSLSQIQRGGIVGAVEIVGSVRSSSSPWWMGPCGLVLRNARPLPFIECKGTVAPLFWTPDAETQSRVAVALRDVERPGQ